MSPAAWAAFVIAGAVGAPVRYLVDRWIAGLAGGLFPWGTFVVNATGSLVLGFLTGLALYHGFPRTPRVVLGTGFCGAYTTFSTFTVETVRLVEGEAAKAALGNVVGSLVVCTTTAALGLVLAML